MRFKKNKEEIKEFLLSKQAKDYYLQMGNLYLIVKTGCVKIPQKINYASLWLEVRYVEKLLVYLVYRNLSKTLINPRLKNLKSPL
ncbi:MAG: hypothetical protein Kow00103_15240 [Candidatus Caldatribacteriota bacterium]